MAVGRRLRAVDLRVQEHQIDTRCLRSIREVDYWIAVAIFMFQVTLKGSRGGPQSVPVPTVGG
jgi:hypothetical protein